MVVVSTSKEIACSPAHVRKVFLDFQRYPQWTQGFIKSIEPQDPNKPTPEAGDVFKVKVEGMPVFTPTILENSERQFKWRGSLPYIFTGDHYFRFEPSAITPGATTLQHGEEFSGLLAAPFSWLGMLSKTGPGFEGFNEDLKREAEKEGGK